MTLATSFEQVLDTNHIPSAEEQNKLRALIRDPEERLRTIEEEILRLQSERDELRRFVDRHQALLSPFRRFPADVWREIFVSCLPNNKLGLCTRTTSEAPLLLTTICRSWRDIALNTPRLWNSIHIYLPLPKIGFDGERFMATMRARNEGFRRWLEKSGSLPLTISLATEDHHRYLPIGTRPTITPDDPKLQGLRAELVNTLARYCQQWRIMAFDEATHSVVASAFGRLTTKDLPLLETVHSNGNVFLWQERDTDDIKPIRLSVIGSLLGRASSLRALQLTRGYFSERSLLSDLPLSWSRLTELSITPPPGHYFDCYILLQLLAKECHSLATLDLDSPTVYFDPEHLGERRLSPVEWPSIRKFVISFNGPLLEHLPVPVFPRPVVEVFESVNLPSLKEFAVDLVGYHNLSSPSCAISLTPWELLLSRSQPAVTHIQLAFPAFLDAKAVIRSLQPLDTLKSLRFGRGDEAWKVHDQALLSAFLEAGTSLCPELEEVEFSACGSETAKTLLELAVRRPSIRVIRARFFLLEDEVETLLPSEQVVRELKMSTSGREGSLQGYIEDVRLIWTWRSHDDLSRDEHNDGMPASSRYHWYDG